LTTKASRARHDKAVVMAKAEWRYVGLVLGQPRLQDPTFAFDGPTVR
jgi:hypothetical protein